MGIHGFAASKEFVTVEQNDTQLTLELHSDEETKKSYPFDFSLSIIYTLRANVVEISYGVKNLGQSTMPFGIGGHPGFNVPLVDGEKFEDYVLEFSCPCRPDRVGFSPAIDNSTTVCYQGLIHPITPLRRETGGEFFCLQTVGNPVK